MYLTFKVRIIIQTNIFSIILTIRIDEYKL